MTLNLTIENIASKIVTGSGYSFEDPKQADDFKTIIHDICLKELEPLFQTLTAQAAQAAAQAALAASVAPVAPAPTVQPFQMQQAHMVQAKRGRNGYNLFCSELRQKLVVTMGSEEAAKKEFNRLGGVTVHCAAEWNNLDEAVKKVYNARAKAERMAPPQQVYGVTPGAVPVGAVPIGTPAKRVPNKWQRFQAAYGKQLRAQNEAKKAAKQPVEAFANIGQHTLACSAAYQLIKDDAPALHAYFAQWSA